MSTQDIKQYPVPATLTEDARPLFVNDPANDPTVVRGPTVAEEDARLQALFDARYAPVGTTSTGGVNFVQETEPVDDLAVGMEWYKESTGVTSIYLDIGGGSFAWTPQAASGADGADGAGVAIQGYDTWSNIDALSSQDTGDVWILSADDAAAPAAGGGLGGLEGDGLFWDGTTWVNIGPLRGPAGTAAEFDDMPAGTMLGNVTGGTAQPVNVTVADLWVALRAVVDYLQSPGDLEVTDSERGLVLTSPDGGKHRVKVDDSGTLVVESPRVGGPAAP